MPDTKRAESASRAFQYDYTALETVRCEADVSVDLNRHVEQLESQRVFLVGSSTLSAKTEGFKDIVSSLGGRFVGLFDSVGAHTPRKDVLTLLAAAREANADLLVSIGGGSVIDATKTVQLALDQNITTAEELLDYAQRGDGSRGPKYQDFDLLGKGSKIRQIAIPTTLSGAEFSNNAGVTDTEIGAKEGYRGIDLCPQIILYDPQLSIHTPPWLWLSTAIRSLDHAVEGYCSADCNSFVEASFLHAMCLFAQSLPKTKQDSTNIDAISMNQQAVWLACNGLGKVAHGASHGIGYILGGLCGVPHGYTSCVMLPAVLQWNQLANGNRQQDIATALGYPGKTASQAVKSLVAQLGLPTCLQGVGVAREQLDDIARRAYKHPVVGKNPRPIRSPDDVREILEIAWH